MTGEQPAPAFRIVAGAPTEEEIAALAAVLSALLAARSAEPASAQGSAAAQAWRESLIPSAVTRWGPATWPGSAGRWSTPAQPTRRPQFQAARAA
jgi:hypothetical protein